MFVFTAREKLDFAMRDVIFDLLSAGKKNIVILPEVRAVSILTDLQSSFSIKSNRSLDN